MDEQTKLILQLLCIAVLLIIYFFLAYRYERFAPVNSRVRTYVMTNRRTWLDPIMRWTHTVNGAVSMTALTAAVAFIFGAYWGSWKQAFVITAAMLFETTFTHATKALHKSERPPQLIADFLMKTHSYPSGHSAASMTFALVVPYFMGMHLTTAQVTPVAILLLINALATAYGRLYLDMHWAIDILGGWCMAGITFFGAQIVIGII